MKRVSLVTVAVALCAAFAVPAISSGAPAPGDSVVANGKLPPTPSGCVNKLTVVAHSGPEGGNPRGALSYDDLKCGRFFIGDIFCLRVEDNRASIIAEFAQNEGDPRFAGLVVWYEDNGPHSGGQPSDFQQNRRLTPAQLANQKANGCPDLIHPGTRITTGNIKIRDRDPVTTKTRD